MLKTSEIIETIRMIDEENLDIRTITAGISLLDCADSSGSRSREKIYEENYQNCGKPCKDRGADRA